MLDTEETRWLKSTANELNNLLQVITESSQVLEKLCGGRSEGDKYFAILRNGVERAVKVTRVMVDRVGGTPPEAATALSTAPAMRVAEPPPPDVKIHNPGGSLELVMIVDDEEFVTLLAQRVMTDRGYRVVTAKDGFEALDIYRKLGSAIDLIILDLNMPLMDGSEVFNELRQMNPNVPVVLSSGFADNERLRAMTANGLRGFIPKPYTQEKLLTEMRSTLDRLRAEKA